MSKLKKFLPHIMATFMLVLFGWLLYSSIIEDIEMDNLKRKKLELEIQNLKYQLELSKIKNKKNE